MGELYERYLKYLQRDEEKKKQAEPDPGTQGDEYIEFWKQRRRERDMLMHFRNDLNGLNIPAEKVMRAYKRVMGEDKAREALKTFRTDVGVLYEVSNYLLHRKDIINSISMIDKLDLHSMDKSAGVIYKLLKAGKITQAEIDTFVAKKLISGFEKLPGGADTKAFLDMLEEEIGPEEVKKLTDQLDAYKDTLEDELKNPVEYPYKARCSLLKNDMPEAVAAYPEKKKEYEEALDYAALHITKTKDKVRDELEEFEKDVSKVDVRREKHSYEVVKPVYEGGRYHGLFVSNPELRGTKYVSKGREKDLQTVLDEGVTLSDKTREGLRLMLKKMEEMKLEDYGYHDEHLLSDKRVVGVMEQGTKFYGMNKLMAKQNALINAMNEMPPSPDKIIAAKKDHEKTAADMRELFDIAKQYFNQDPNVFPGNMDSWRHHEFPHEFTGDCHTLAQINGVFLAYQNWKQNGVDLEEYLKRPTKATVDNMVKRLEEVSFKKKAESAKSLEDTLELMSASGKFAEADKDYDYMVHERAMIRPLKLPVLLEGDPQLSQRNNLFANITMHEFGDGLKNTDIAKFGYFSLSPAGLNDFEYDARLKTLQNLMLVSDADRDPSKLMHGVPDTDMYGRVIKDPFNAESYMKKTPVDYAGIMERAGRVYNKIAAMKNVPMNITTDDVLRATQQLYLRVLAAHPEDVEKEGYKQMQAAMTGLRNRLSENVDDETKLDMKKLESGYKKVLKDAAKRYRNEQKEEGKLNEIKERLTFEQFTESFAELGLSDENFRYLYDHLSRDEMKSLLKYTTDHDDFGNIFHNWDRPYNRRAESISKLAPGARMSGDAGALRKYLEDNEEKLNAADKLYLLKHIEMAEKVAQMQREGAEALEAEDPRPAKPELLTDNEGFMQLNIRQPRAQSSANGCWSVALQQIVQGRGTEDISQEDIRSYRPGERTVDEINAHFSNDGGLKEADQLYNMDTALSVKDMLDPVLAFAPNTMVRVMEIGAYDPAANKALDAQGIGPAQYRQNAKELIRQTVEKALVIDRSPLVIRQPGHFVNIVGIKDDILLIQDPLGSVNPPERMRKVPIDSFVEAMLFKKGRDGDVTRNIQLLWGSDIKLDNEGNILGIPDEGVKVADNGDIQLNAQQQGENGFLLETQKNGLWINKYGNQNGVPTLDEQLVSKDGLIRSDRVYLPRKLNVTGLKKEAAKRSPEEELKLKEEALVYFQDAADLKGKAIRDVQGKGLDAVRQEVAEERAREEQRKNLPEHLNAEQSSEKEVQQGIYDKGLGYIEALTEYKKNARELLEELRRTGIDAQADPAEYTKLIGELESVCALSVKNTPARIAGTMLGLTEASKNLSSTLKDTADNATKPDANRDERRKLADKESEWLKKNVEQEKSELLMLGASGAEEANISIEEMLRVPAAKLGVLRTKEEEAEVSKNAGEFAEKVENLASVAKKRLETLNGLGKIFGEDSTQYVNMKNALKSVSKLGRGNTALEVTEAVSALETYTKAYTDKLEQFGGGKLYPGAKRLDAALAISEDVKQSGLADLKKMPAGVLPTVDLRLQAEAGYISKLNEMDFEMVDGVKLRKDYHEAVEEMKKTEKKMKETASKEPVNTPNETKDDKRRKLDKNEVKDFLSSEKKEKKEHSRKTESKENTAGKTKDKDTTVKKGGGV
ncbi:MAG: hypothetical protein K6B44_00970 [Lachnospiraceae bacterium]|nr:hypothetical protein [Lachnospiraceae bacterium]